MRAHVSMNTWFIKSINTAGGIICSNTHRIKLFIWCEQLEMLYFISHWERPNWKWCVFRKCYKVMKLNLRSEIFSWIRKADYDLDISGALVLCVGVKMSLKWLMSLIFLERLFAFCNHGNDKDVICASYLSWTNYFQQENKCWLLTTQNRIYLQHTKTTSWITSPWRGTDCCGCGCDGDPRNTNWHRPMSNIIRGTCRRIQVLPRLTGVKGVRSVELIFVSYTIKKRRKKLTWNIYITTEYIYKGKVFPLQAQCGPEGG